MKNIEDFINSLKFDDKGLIPVVIQDYKSKKVLMVAYMNKEALFKTIETKKVHFYSRSRQKLWMKGEESGNIQLLKEIFIDCDSDCLLLKVKQEGKAACHDGYISCFYRKLNKNGSFKIIEKKIFNPENVYKNK